VQRDKSHGRGTLGKKNAPALGKQAHLGNVIGAGWGILVRYSADSCIF